MGMNLISSLETENRRMKCAYIELESRNEAN
jgi:hypothetical protein